MTCKDYNFDVSKIGFIRIGLLKLNWIAISYTEIGVKLKMEIQLKFSIL